jgi:hypothetical protein
VQRILAKEARLARRRILMLAGAAAVCVALRANGAITLIGAASIPGDAGDRSGQTGKVLDNGGHPLNVARNTFGGAGSAIDYTGSGDLYVMASDRGPNNGDAQYDDRVHWVRIVVKPGEARSVSASVVDTTLLTPAAKEGRPGMHYSGSSAAFVGQPGFAGKETLRLDPEGIRMSGNGDGSFWISDEYGPYVLKFDRAGEKIDEFVLPAKYRVAISSADERIELTANKIGRQVNRGMEGLAITPDGKTLVGLMQNALLQDHGLDEKGARASIYTRLVTMNLQDRTVHEYVYLMESAKFGMNEILAVNSHEFLVIERDGKSGKESASKKIYRVDLDGASDISKPFAVAGKSFDYSGTTAANGLPGTGTVAGVKPVSKTLFLDMLDTRFGLGGDDFPEKLEGLAWGPDFENGDKLLIVSSDNDFMAKQGTWFFAFRVGRENL